MTFRKLDRQVRQDSWILAVVHWRTSISIRAAWVQWSIAAVLGLMLGLFLLIVIPWRPRWALFLALAALFPFVAIIVGDVRRILLAIIILETPLHLDVNLFYDGHAVTLNAIGGLNVSITTFCLAALYALWLVELLAKVTALPGVLRTSLPMLVYLVAVVVSILVAQNTRLALFEIFLLFQSFLLLLYLIKFVQSRQDLIFVVTLLLIGLTFESLAMIGLRILGHSISVARIKIGIDATGRVSGTLGSPNTAASYLTLMLASSLGVMLTSLKRRFKWLAAVAFFLGTIALLFTFSRGGWLAYTISTILFCLLAFYRGWLSLRVPLIIAAVILLVLLVFQEPFSARLFGDDLGAANSRTTMARQALQMIKDHPLLGVGANNYAVFYEQNYALEPGQRRLRTAHNKYLLIWAETGIFGLMAFLGFLIAIIHRGWQGWQLRDRLLSPLVLGFTIAILGQMAHMFFDIFHSRPQVQTLWIVVALVIAVWNLGVSTGKGWSKVRRW